MNRLYVAIVIAVVIAVAFMLFRPFLLPSQSELQVTGSVVESELEQAESMLEEELEQAIGNMTLEEIEQALTE